ncbi:hypothetical protein DQ04_25301000, partial [Trypanosoma grayi]|uniref:hypothetical protein n=1 Tax=Trypanosoma grayi TaxID=71804 RepID=UPI0004F42EB5
ERGAMQALQRNGAPSALEALLAGAIGVEALLQSAPGSSSTASTSSSSSSPPPQQQQQEPKQQGNHHQLQQQHHHEEDDEEERRRQHQEEAKRGKENGHDWEAPHHPEITAGLNEYEDSIDFSDASVADTSSIDETPYDYIERL